LHKLNCRIKLYCKGADSVIFKRLANLQDALIKTSQQHLEDFAKCGFRTLCMAEREVCNVNFDIEYFYLLHTKIIFIYVNYKFNTLNYWMKLKPNWTMNIS